MPVIGRHHKDDTWRPHLSWPDDCSVQWGGNGIVLSKKGSRRTAFFEVFPYDGAGGFIRGEGVSLEQAEQEAYQRWQTQFKCYQSGGHRWSRTRRLKNGKFKTYTNGGCFCLKCGGFQTAMKPIMKLGRWRDPLCASELALLSMGSSRPSSESLNDRNSARWLELRAKMFGVNLPNWRDSAYEETAEWPDEDVYESACADAVAHFYARYCNDSQARPHATGSVFAEMMGGFHVTAIRERAIGLGLIV